MKTRVCECDLTPQCGRGPTNVKLINLEFVLPCVDRVSVSV